MKFKYFEDTDTLYIELCADAIVETRDLDENILLELDAAGRVCDDDGACEPTNRCEAFFVAVYKEFEASSVLGAMDTMYQRGKIQDESMYYSMFDQGRKKHDGSLPLIGVSTFLPKEHGGDISASKIVDVARKVHSDPGFAGFASPARGGRSGWGRERCWRPRLANPPATSRTRPRQRVCAVDGGGEVQQRGADQSRVV